MTALYWADGALRLEAEGDIARLRLARPEKRNAINRAVWDALPLAAAAVDADRALKVMILSGSGGHFSAGADIAEFGAAFATPESTASQTAAIGRGIEAIAAMDKPVIAAIEGNCVGGGVALALACDLRVAAHAARFAVTPAKLGFLYSLSDTRRLVEAVGASAAKRILFTGAPIEAERALALGLVDTLAPAGEAEAAATSEALLIAAASQFTVRRTKAVLRKMSEGSACADDIRQWFQEAVEGEDFSEGYRAFLEKRGPRFSFRG